MNPDEHHSDFIKPIKLCFWFFNNCNISFENHKPSFRRYIKACFAIVCALAFYVGCILFLVEIFGQAPGVKDIALIVGMFSFMSQTMVKVIIIVSKKEEMVNVINQMSTIWKRQSEELTELQKIKINAMLKKLNVFLKLFKFASFFGALFYALIPVIEVILYTIVGKDCEPKLRFSCKYPFDPYQSYYVYLMVYAYETYSICQYVFAYLGTISLLMVLSSHIVTEFSLLRDDLFCVRVASDSNESIVESDKTMSIGDYVKRHQELIDLSKRLDSIFAVISFVYFMFGAIIMCSFGFAGSISHKAVDMIENFFAVVGSLVPLFVLSYQSEMLRQESTGIAESLYNHLWYKGNVRYQKTVLIIIMRSQRPCCLTTAKYSPIMQSTLSKVNSSLKRA